MLRFQLGSSVEQVLAPTLYQGLLPEKGSSKRDSYVVGAFVPLFSIKTHTWVHCGSTDSKPRNRLLSNAALLNRDQTRTKPSLPARLLINPHILHRRLIVAACSGIFRAPRTKLTAAGVCVCGAALTQKRANDERLDSTTAFLNLNLVSHVLRIIHLPYANLILFSESGAPSLGQHC